MAKSPLCTEGSIVRKTADFHPPIWGDLFSHHVPDDKITSDTKDELLSKLKDAVKKELLDAGIINSPTQQLIRLIDDVQRLGVGYHFEEEIQKALQNVYEKHGDYAVNNIDGLYDVSLRFRLLRQQGFNISCDIFNKFKDGEGHFSEKLSEDTKGILSLYEATFMQKNQEELLDEAQVFCLTQLELIQDSNNLSGPLRSQVNRVLTHPIRKSVPRLEARNYMSFYHEIDSYNGTLLELAKLDYNLLQSMHRKELSENIKWWNGLDFETKLPFARSRVIEVYFWMVSTYYEPEFSIGRVILSKVVAIVSCLDDIYDLYGTHEELELFTEAIVRWDSKCMDQLPEYMKHTYQAILDLYDFIEEEMAKRGRSYSVQFAKEAMKRQANAYLQEAKWYKEGYVPAFEEYIDHALISSVYPFIALVTFLGVDKIATKEVFEWIYNVPKIVRASSIIGRLLDDIVSHKFEQSRGHIPSAVECCMKEYGVSEEEAYGVIRKRLASEWKVINEECLEPCDVAMPLMRIVLNLTSVAEIFYKEGDGYTQVGKQMQERIRLMLIDPVPV